MVSSAGVVSAVGVLDREAVDFYMINVAVSLCLMYTNVADLIHKSALAVILKKFDKKYWHCIAMQRRN